ncbi:MAG: TolC family protein [Armatimonadetes bacterium]|nr:TolC family protein [Armatimonadota bacterium]
MNARGAATAFWLVMALVLPTRAVPAWAQAPAQTITLGEAVARALQHNLQVRVAVFEVSVVRHVLAAARAGKSPQATVTTSYGRSDSTDQYLARVGVEFPLYTGGRLEAQIALAEASLRGAEATLERVRQSVILSTKQAYYQLLLARAQQGTAQRVLAQAQGNLGVALARLQAGAVPRFDVLQAEVSVAAAEQQVVRTQTDVALARHALAAQVNLPLDAPLEPQEVLATAAVRVELPVLLEQGVRSRPELAELRARIDAAVWAREVAASGGRPTVTLAVTPGVAGSGPGSLGGTWSATLSATLSAFDGGVTAERVREAEARLAVLRASEAQQRQAIELEVRQAWLSLRASLVEVKTAARGVEQAREALRVANVRYQAGASVNLEVLVQQSALSQAETSHTQTLYNHNVALAQLERAVGGPVQ